MSAEYNQVGGSPSVSTAQAISNNTNDHDVNIGSDGSPSQLRHPSCQQETPIHKDRNRMTNCSIANNVLSFVLFLFWFQNCMYYAYILLYQK